MAHSTTATAIQLPLPTLQNHAAFSKSSVRKSPLASPIEISQQLQRVDALHQQLKTEAARAQEFLLKLRRGEYETQAQAKLQSSGATSHQQHQHSAHESLQRGIGPSAHGKGLDDDDDDDNNNNIHTASSVTDDSQCQCSCQHHSPSSPSSDFKSRRQASNQSGSLPFQGRVDEREVRDLEKRVRGLEGRVRGFEGLPPDREMALLEVERLRRELESLAKRREGLFEGLGSDLLESAGFKRGAKAPVAVQGTAKRSGGGRTSMNGKSMAAGKK